MEAGRHGDVVFTKRLTELPKGAKPVSMDGRKRAVCAEGEVTGHYHAFVSTTEGISDALVAQIYTLENDKDHQVVEVKHPCTLYHQEHAPIPFEPGIHMFRIQDEYDMVGEYRKVKD